jgi:hypothetical protein
MFGKDPNGNQSTRLLERARCNLSGGFPREERPALRYFRSSFALRVRKAEAAAKAAGRGPFR